jgi:hypothetical protein
VGLDETFNPLLRRLHAVWRRHPPFGDRPGLVALVAHGADVHVEALGSLAIGGAPVARDSLFRIGRDFFAGRSWGFCQAVHDTGAFGWDGGLGTSWLVDPAADLVVIVLTQRMFETSEPPPVHGDIQAAAYAALA